jgi:hypothetical protein
MPDEVIDWFVEEELDDKFTLPEWEPKSYGDTEWIESVVNFFAN